MKNVTRASVLLAALACTACAKGEMTAAFAPFVPFPILDEEQDSASLDPLFLNPPLPKIKPQPPETMLAANDGFAAEREVPGIAAVVPEPEPTLPTEDQPTASLDALVGLDSEGVALILGNPDWTEDAPPARTWQYASKDCVLQVFFFMEMSTQDFRALSYQMTSNQGTPEDENSCFNQLLAEASSAQVTPHGTN